MKVSSGGLQMEHPEEGLLVRDDFLLAAISETSRLTQYPLLPQHPVE
jgi:hypothetical protein